MTDVEKCKKKMPFLIKISMTSCSFNLTKRQIFFIIDIVMIIYVCEQYGSNDLIVLII